ETALALNPQLAEGWYGRGGVLSSSRRFEEAMAAYDRAIALNPDMASAWLARGTILSEVQRHEEALVAYDKAVTIDSSLKFAEGARLLSKLVVSDLSNFDEESEHLLAAVRSGHPATIPFVLLLLPASADDQLTCARLFVDDQILMPAPLWRGE